MRNVARAFLGGISAGRALEAPSVAGDLAPYYRHLGQFSAAFATMADVALMVLGGALKRREAFSGRMADMLGQLYLCSATLKRFEDDDCPPEDLPLLHWSCRYAFWHMQEAADAAISNFPQPVLRLLLRACVLPAGRRMRPPSDSLQHQVAALMLQPGEGRDRLTAGIHLSDKVSDPLGCLEHALEKTVAAEPVIQGLGKQEGGRRQANETHEEWLMRLQQQGMLNEAELKLLQQAHAAMLQAIAVDDFAPSRRRGGKEAA